MNENLVMIKELMEDINLASKGMSTKFDVADLELKLKEQIVALFGKDNPTYQDLKRNPNSNAFFAILEEYIGVAGSTQLQEVLSFAEIKNEAWGDDTRFEIENPELFDVVVVAKGNGNVRRQRIDTKFVTIPTEAVAIKIFDNFKRFLAGRVNWSAMITKVAQSYAKEIQERVMTALYSVAPVNGSAVFNVTDAGGFKIQSVRDMIDHVQAQNQNAEVAIIGTRQALLTLSPVISTDEANKDLYTNGYYTTAEGYRLIPVKQMHVKNTFNFLLSNKQLMVIPMTGEKMVKIMEEGTPIIEDMPLNVNGDMSKEYLFYREVGVGVVSGTRFGKYQWS
jgi:hypothetical protein